MYVQQYKFNLVSIDKFLEKRLQFSFKDKKSRNLQIQTIIFR